MESIIEGTNIGTWEWNVQTGEVRVNERWARMLGYTLDELTPVSIDTWQRFCHPDDWNGSIKLLDQHFAGDQPYYHYEARMKHKDGNWIWVFDCGCVVTRTENGTPLMMFGTLSDITERKMMEAQKEKFDALNRQIQKADSLHRMAGAIAHLFNNQLGVVIGNLELATHDLRHKVTPVRSMNAAMQGARKAAEVSGLMLTYLGQTTGRTSPLNLSEITRKTLPLIQATAPKDLVLTVDLADPGPTINANDHHIQQVLTNLVTNGWEASANHGSVRLTVKTVQQTAIPATHRLPIDWQPIDPAYACLEVVDAGCGISPDDLDRLFDPFFSNKFAGRGLGLPVVLGIVKAYNGAVAVESEVGHGSTFRVFFPLSADTTCQSTITVAGPSRGEMSGMVPRVDDEEMIKSATPKGRP